MLRFAPDPAGYFEASVSAGSSAYWRALDPARTTEYVYFGRFRNYGPGFVIVRVMTAHPGASPELQHLGFGLPMLHASKERVADMMGALMQPDPGSRPSR